MAENANINKTKMEAWKSSFIQTHIFIMICAAFPEKLTKMTTERPRTHLPFKFKGNSFRSLCVNLLTNQPTIQQADANVHAANKLAFPSTQTLLLLLAQRHCDSVQNYSAVIGQSALQRATCVPSLATGSQTWTLSKS